MTLMNVTQVMQDSARRTSLSAIHRMFVFPLGGSVIMTRTAVTTLTKWTAVCRDALVWLCSVMKILPQKFEYNTRSYIIRIPNFNGKIMGKY